MKVEQIVKLKNKRKKRRVTLQNVSSSYQACRSEAK